MSGLYDLAVGVSRTVRDFFPVFWLLGLVLALGWALSRKNPATAPGRTPAPLVSTKLDHFALAAFAMFTAFYVFIFCYRVEFADADHSIYTWSLMRNQGISSPMWPGSGRFFPLGHQEFDLLRHAADPLKAYFVLAVVQLLAFLGVLYVLLDDFRIAARVLVLGLVLVTPSIFTAFSGLIYTERNLLLLMAVIALCIRRYALRPSVWLAAATLAATQLALYYKEPMFLFVAGVAGIPLLQSWLAPRDEPRSIRRTIAAHPIETGMLGLALIFVLLYVGFMLPYRNMGYAANHFGGQATPAGVLLWYLQSDPILLVFFLTLAYRSVRILTRKERIDAFWDPLALGSLLYFATYIALGMAASWYTSPIDLIAILYVAERARKAVAEGRMRAALPIGLAIVVAVPLVATVWYTAVRRKNVVQGRVALAEFLRRTADTSAAPLRVFIPRQPTYTIMEFGTLLLYKGVQVVPDSLAAGRAGVVVLHARDYFPKGRCVPYRPVPCSHAEEAPDGSLVLTFPDDEASPRAAVTLRPDGVPLFVYQPFAMPPVMPWLKRIRTMLRERQATLRTDWLWAYVIVADGKGRRANGGWKAE